MIKLLILLFLMILLFFILKNLKRENFHEKTGSVENNQSEVIKDCESCSFCDYNPDPETKPYVISRCLLQHTLTSGEFKEAPSGCRSHKDLSSISGCIDALKQDETNINNLKQVNRDNSNCRCEYSLDDNSLENNLEKQSYNSWIKTL